MKTRSHSEKPGPSRLRLEVDSDGFGPAVVADLPGLASTVSETKEEQLTGAETRKFERPTQYHRAVGIAILSALISVLVGLCLLRDWMKGTGL